MSVPQPQPPSPRPRAGVRPPTPILILDDERVDRYRLARLCSSLGFPCQISNATTLAEFSEMLERDVFTLILIDYSLPDGSGLDALEMVRLSGINLNAVSLMVTGMDPMRISDRAYAAGCAGFLSKDDLSPDRFASAVGKVLGATLWQPKARKSYATGEVEQMLSLCATMSARAIKPRISRLMRQIRDIRSGVTDPADGMRRLEQDCMSLWHFLIERERDEGPHHLAELLAGQSRSQEPPERPRADRPPSPFGTRKH